MTVESPEVESVPLTDRQREVWEMSHGLGQWKESHPDGMKAQEIGEKLGISANSVYVTRRRVRQILEDRGALPTSKQPKRIRQESGLDQAKAALEAQIAGYESERKALTERLEQIEAERPEVEAALERLRSVGKAPEQRTLVAA